MKKRILAWVLALVMIVGLLPTVAFAADLGGSGTEDDPYLITSADDLAAFRDKVNATKKGTSTLCGKLTTNIDLSRLSGDWTPIGNYVNSYSNYTYYAGTFDGAGHTISGLHIDNAKQYQALFGYVKGGTVKNLTVEGSVKTSATSSPYAAGIVAYGNAATMENCANKADVTGTAKGYLAGIMGYAYSGSKISSCTNTGKITAAGEYIGGIVGTGTGTSVVGCINSGTIVSTGKPGSYTYSVGGIAGSLTRNSTVQLCGNTGTVNSTV